MHRGQRYIDSDAHVLEPSDLWERYLDPAFRRDAPRHEVGYRGDPPSWALEIRVGDTVMPSFPMGQGIAVPGLEEAYADYIPREFGPDCYRDVLERTGIDYMVVYPTVGLYVTGVPGLSPELAAAYRRAYNDWLYDFGRQAGPRVLCAGSVDLRDPEEAAREARRCVEKLGFRAITFNPEPVVPAPLHDPFFDPLWRAVSELGVPIGVHVAAGTSLHQVGIDYFSQWTLGRSLCAFTIGNMIACLSFVGGGILERYPELRVAFLESGAGWAAFWLDRMKAGVAGGSREFDIPGLSSHPIEYFQRQCFISADPDDPGIAQVKAAMGDDCIVTATDFGHVEGKGYVRALDDVLDLPGLGDETKRKVMWDNPARLYGLD